MPYSQIVLVAAGEVLFSKTKQKLKLNKSINLPIRGKRQMELNGHSRLLQGGDIGISMVSLAPSTLRIRIKY